MENAKLPTVEVTVAPGHSMRDASEDDVTWAAARLPDGSSERRVVDVAQRVVLPGQKLRVRADAVPLLIAMGVVLDPATNETNAAPAAPAPMMRTS